MFPKQLVSMALLQNLSPIFVRKLS